MMMLVNIDEEETSRNDMSHVRYCIGMAAVLLFAAIAMFLLNGCGMREIEVVPAAEEPELPEMSAHAGDEMTEEEILNITAGAASDSLSNEEYVADAADVPDDAVLTGDTLEDPYGMYLVTEDLASKLGGLYANLDGNVYSLANLVPSTVINDYGVGYIVGPDNANVENDYALLYLRDDKKGLRDDIPSATRYAIVSSGDFPALRVHRGDQLMVFGKPMIEKMFFEKADFVGYTIPACDSPGTTLAYYPVVNNYYANNVDKDHIGVFDLNDVQVEDVRNLEQGKEYLYECYIGTEYRELKVRADSRCYSLDSGEYVELPMQITKLGYFTIDTSSLELGFYTSSEYNAVFEIVD